MASSFNTQSVTTPAGPLSRPLHAKLAIRDATGNDMAAVQRIYAHHVLNSTATFEETPPTIADMQARHAHIVEQGFPYLVAELNGEIAGYCYASPYRPRVAYRYTIEDSIYLAPDHTGRGLGKALLTELINRCELGPWRQMIAVIAGSNNTGSINLHRKLGFIHAGVQKSTGFKFNQWIDVIFMQRPLGAGDSTAADNVLSG